MYSGAPFQPGHPSQGPGGHPGWNHGPAPNVPPSGYGVPDSQALTQHNYQGITPPPNQAPPQQNYSGGAPRPKPAMYSQAPPQQNYAGGAPPANPAYQGLFQGHGEKIATGYPAYSINQFVADTEPSKSTAPFEVDKSRPSMLQVSFGLAGSSGGQLQQVFIKKGSMVAYNGDIKFEREGFLEHGVGHLLKKAITTEGARLVKATAKGHGQLFLADANKMVTVLQLQGDSISVNGDDLLAFEPSLKHKIVMMTKLSAIVAGGLFNVKLSGYGCVAILSHGKPLTLEVAQGKPPVFTDPGATVAWSGDLTPDFNTDLQFKTLLGRGSGESFQMKFDPRKGTGFVVVQPYEEIAQKASWKIS